MTAGWTERSWREPRNQMLHRIWCVCATCLLLFALPTLFTRNGVNSPACCWAQDAQKPAEAKAIDTAKKELLVTNVFSDTDLKQALEDISTQVGITIVADNTVQGTVTADLKNVPLEKALTMVLAGGGYTFAKQGDYYLVGMPDPSNPNYAKFCQVETINLKYTTPQMMLSLLNVAYGRYLSAEGASTMTWNISHPGSTSRFAASTSQASVPDVYTSSQPSSSTSSPVQGSRIVITAPPQMIPDIRANIERLDQPQPQVMLEACVVEISQDTLKSLGVDWATHWIRQDLTSGGPNLIYSSIENAELVKITALLQENRATLRANPRVATIDGMMAELEVGKENYFQITTGNLSYAYATLEKITSGILLRITPKILMPEREVIVSVEPEVRDVTGQGTNGLPEITFRRAAANVRVKDGQSIIIGGLVNEYVQKQTRKVPILGDLPLIGWIFRRTDNTRTEDEVVIIITPHILCDGEPVCCTVSPALQQQLCAPASGTANTMK